MRMTPRKLHALLTVHYDLMEAKYGGSTDKVDTATNGYIDTIPGW